MNNAQLRAKALAKVKDKNFSLQAALSFAIAAVTMLVADITGVLVADVAIMLVAAFAAGLVCVPGFVKVSMSVWRQGKGGLGELFSPFTGLEQLKRGALPAGVYALMLVIFRFAVLGTAWYVALAAGIAVILLGIIAAWGAYGIELMPEICPVKAFCAGLKNMMNGVARIFEMKLYLYWWIAAVIALTVYLCNISPLPGVITGLVVFLVALLCRWMVGALIGLCEAGLAREIFKN